MRIKEKLEELGKAIAAHPEKARAKHAAAAARLTGGLRCEIRGPNGESAHTDMPPAMGGEASAPSPGWLLRASIASCTATAIAMRAATSGIELSRLEVTVESDGDNRGLLGLDDAVSAGLSAIRTRVRLAAAGVPHEQLRELAKWGDEHSPMACTARERPGYQLDLEIVS